MNFYAPMLKAVQNNISPKEILLDIVLPNFYKSTKKRKSLFVVSLNTHAAIIWAKKLEYAVQSISNNQELLERLQSAFSEEVLTHQKLKAQLFAFIHIVFKLDDVRSFPKLIGLLGWIPNLSFSRDEIVKHINHIKGNLTSANTKPAVIEQVQFLCNLGPIIAMVTSQSARCEILELMRDKLDQLSQPFKNQFDLKKILTYVEEGEWKDQFISHCKSKKYLIEAFSSSNNAQIPDNVAAIQALTQTQQEQRALQFHNKLMNVDVNANNYNFDNVNKVYVKKLSELLLFGNVSMSLRRLILERFISRIYMNIIGNDNFQLHFVDLITGHNLIDNMPGVQPGLWIPDDKLGPMVEAFESLLENKDIYQNLLPILYTLFDRMLPDLQLRVTKLLLRALLKHNKPSDNDYQREVIEILIDHSVPSEIQQNVWQAISDKIKKETNQGILADVLSGMPNLATQWNMSLDTLKLFVNFVLLNLEEKYVFRVWNAIKNSTSFMSLSPENKKYLLYETGMDSLIKAEQSGDSARAFLIKQCLLVAYGEDAYQSLIALFSTEEAVFNLYESNNSSPSDVSRLVFN